MKSITENGLYDDSQIFTPKILSIEAKIFKVLNNFAQTIIPRMLEDGIYFFSFKPSACAMASSIPSVLASTLSSMALSFFSSMPSSRNC